MNQPRDYQKLLGLLDTLGISLDRLFQMPVWPRRQVIMRLIGGSVLRVLPTHWRYILTGILKWARNPTKRLSVTYPLEYAEAKTVVEAIGKSPIYPWWDKAAAVCVTHDVDNDIGAAFVAEMVDIDNSHGFISTFNFLTHDNYRLEPETIKNLIAKGFEVGLHGYTHDQGFAFRGRKTIRYRLDQSVKKLGINQNLGFRAPALSSSDKLFEILGENGITYDSSFQLTASHYSSVRLPYPVFLKKYRLWEIPMTLQDDLYLRDASTGDEEMLLSIQKVLNEIIALRGVFVINLHPHLMCKRIELYRRILKAIYRPDETAIVTTGQIVRYLEECVHV